jgi:hypothetical protein
MTAPVDPFATLAVSPLGPANDAFAVTPSDSVAFASVATRLYVGGAGDVTLITHAGNTVLFKSVPAGTVLPIRCTQVMNTATTATLMLGLI